MKLLIKLNNLELEKYLEFTNSFIIGLENYSVNYFETSVDEIKKLLEKYPNIELFVSMNKNIFNADLDDLQHKLRMLDKLKIKGIMFYDISILSLVNNMHLNIPLVIHQEHMITNYNICNYYAEKGVKYAYLSTDITTDEIIEISKKTKINLIIFIAGNVIVTHSKRKLLTNYYQYLASKEEKNKNLNKLKNGIIVEKKVNNNDEQTIKYYIEETNLGTNILTDQILNGAGSFLKLRDYANSNKDNSDLYIVLDSNMKNSDMSCQEINDKLLDSLNTTSISDGKMENKCTNENEIFLSLLNLYKFALNEKIDDETFLKNTSDILKNNDFDGFFNKKTIYKVKK